MQKQTAMNMDISESPRCKDSEHGTQSENSTVLKRRKAITEVSYWMQPNCCEHSDRAEN